MEAAEETYYSDVPNNIYVTNARLIVGETTYQIGNITASSVASIQDEAEVLLDTGYLGEELVIGRLRRIKGENPELRKKYILQGENPDKIRVGSFDGYALFICTSSGEEEAIKHLNETEIEKINNALNYAVTNFK